MVIVSVSRFQATVSADTRGRSMSFAAHLPATRASTQVAAPREAGALLCAILPVWLDCGVVDADWPMCCWRGMVVPPAA
jgi:hypothetical protein